MSFTNEDPVLDDAERMTTASDVSDIYDPQLTPDLHIPAARAGFFGYSEEKTLQKVCRPF